jgi:two-component system NtrC family sensor kinase
MFRRLREALALSRGLRTHLLTIGASVLVPLALFSIAGWLDRAALLRAAEADVGRGADSVREHAVKVLQTDELVIALIDQRIQSMSWDDIAASRPLHDYLAKLVQQAPELEGAFIADASGAVRNSSRFFPARSSSIASRRFFLAARESNGLKLGELVDDDEFPDENVAPHFHLAARRSSADGRFDGVIVLSMFSSYFPEVWRHSWHGGPEAMTDFTTGNFKVLAREPPSWTGQLKLTPPAIAALRANPTIGTFRTVSSVDRVDRIASYRRVDPYNAYVIYGVSFDSVLRTWYQHLVVYGGIFGLAALALCTVSLIAARHIEGERIAMRQLAAETNKRHMTEKQLFEAEKLEAIGKVTGGFAHDFGNLLMAIQLNLDMMIDRVTGEAREALDTIKAEVQRGNEAIRSLMIFARRGSLETEIVNAGTRIEQMSGLFRQAIGAHSTVEISVEEHLWPIEINVNQLELALLNLAVNARDAMPEGGKLRIAARNVTLAGAPDGLSGDFVEISITDTGIGMPAEIAAKAFQPFFTTKVEGKGTGLGLSQVHGFAKDCGGTATVSSAPRHGTAVTIYIPKCAASIPRTQGEA